MTPAEMQEAMAGRARAFREATARLIASGNHLALAMHRITHACGQCPDRLCMPFRGLEQPEAKCPTGCW